jgi:polyferredoxin
MSKNEKVIKIAPRRKKPELYRWPLALLMITTLALGWKFPWLGFIVPVVMLTAILYSLRKGRYACGNICPRGSFFDTFFRFVGGNRATPPWLRSLPVRWSVFAGLMGFMGFQLMRHPGSAEHWGSVFWLACAVTTAIAIVLGLVWQPRTWCAICPIGTLTATIGEEKYPMQIAASCKACGLCEQSCPMELAIAAQREAGSLQHGDCLKCSSCHAACPQQALSWPKAA